MTSDRQPYRSYLVRLWQEEEIGKGVWRASLQNVQTRQTVHFARLSDLCEYLFCQTGAPSEKEDRGAEESRRE